MKKLEEMELYEILVLILSPALWLIIQILKHNQNKADKRYNPWK